MAVALKDIAVGDGLYALAKQALIDCDRDEERALELFIQWVLDDRALIEKAVRESADYMLKQVVANERRHLLKSMSKEPQPTEPTPLIPKKTVQAPRSVAGLEPVVNRNAETLYGMALPYLRDITLGNARVEHLHQSLDAIGRSLRTTGAQRVFLKYLAERLPREKTVRQVWTASDLEKLWQKSQTEVDKLLA